MIQPTRALCRDAFLTGSPSRFVLKQWSGYLVKSAPISSRSDRAHVKQVDSNSRLSGGLDTKISAVSSSLRGSVLPIVEDLVGPSHRPVVLARRLGIDKTLTGRILRSVKASDPFEILHNAPAPYGLRIFLKAAAEAGVNEDLRQKAEASIADFEALIDAFPEGRSALEAAISDYIPEVRRRNERTAKQAVYKSMSYLLGYQAETLFHASLLSPSADGRMVDSLHIGGLVELRRLRGDAPVNLFGVRRYEMQAGVESWIETLDGERGATDADRYLLDQYCDKEMPRLSVRDTGNVIYSVLDAESLPINTPVTLVNGWMTRNASLRYRSEDRTHEWHTALVRIPSRVRIQDYFIHEDIWPHAPEMRPRMHGLAADPVRAGSDSRQPDELDIETPVEMLGRGIDSPELRDPSLPRYQQMLREVFERSGMDPARFRTYRCKVVYPVPFVSLTAWFELPPEPAA